MSTRRNIDVQANETFIEDHPELERTVTTLEVGEGRKGRPDIEATQDGEEIRVRLQDTEKTPPFVTIAESARLPDGRLSTTSTDDDDGPQNKQKIDTDLVLTEDGFGVRTESFGGEEQQRGKNGDIDDTTIEEGEALTLQLSGPRDQGPQVQSEDGPDEELDFLELGGVSLLIDYEVVSGSGDVVVTLIDRDADRDEGRVTTFEEFAAGGRRGAAEGSIEASLEGDHYFDRAEVTVEGDLEIVVTGIQYVTNFGDNIVDPT